MINKAISKIVKPETENGILKTPDRLKMFFGIRGNEAGVSLFQTKKWGT